MMPHFLTKLPDGPKIRIRGAYVVIGEQEICDIRLSEGHPSRVHAQIHMVSDAAWIEDLNSTNGTTLNQKLVKGLQRLAGGDELSFDEERYRYDYEGHLDECAGGTQINVRRQAPEEGAAAPGTGQTVSREKQARARERERLGGRVLGGVPRSETRLMPHSEAQTVFAIAEGTGTSEVVDVPVLIIRSGLSAGRVFRLELDGAGNGFWDVGAHDEDHLVLEDPSVSRHHARLLCDHGRWRIIDQMSKNGVRLNGVEVEVQQFLNAGDSIQLGDVICQLLLPEVRAD